MMVCMVFACFNTFLNISFLSMLLSLTDCPMKFCQVSGFINGGDSENRKSTDQQSGKLEESGDVREFEI